MKDLARLFIVILIATGALSQTSHAQDDTMYIATYVEAMPNSDAAATRLLKRYRDVSSRQDGNLRFDVLQEIARANRFVIVEQWKDQAALDAHQQSAATTTFRDSLKAIENAPYDQRIDTPLYGTQGASNGSADIIYVVTHIDVVPTGKDACLQGLQAMSSDTVKEPGNISYQALQQANRSNHFTVIEAWRNMKAAQAHAMAEHTRAFRAKLVPIAGALYDERFYKAVQ